MAQRDPQEIVKTVNSKGETIEVSIPKLPRFIAPVTKEFLVASRAYEIEHEINETQLVAQAVAAFIGFTGKKLTDASGTRGPAKKYATPELAKKARAASTKKNVAAKNLLYETMLKERPDLVKELQARAAAQVEAAESKPKDNPKK